MNPVAILILALSVCAFSPYLVAGEVLGHISEDNAPEAPPPTPTPGDDRRIIYRVICSPEGEALPDCEQPFHDTESLRDQKPTEAAEVLEETLRKPDARPAKKVATGKPKKSKTNKAKKTTAKKTKSQARTQKPAAKKKK